MRTRPVQSNKNHGFKENATVPGKVTGNLCWKVCTVTALFIAVASCGAKVVGLQPEYPPVTKRPFSILAEFVEVGSLTPTLSWEPFPRPIDLERKGKGRLDNITDVTYELRIWKTDTGYAGKLVYGREGLTEPHHTLEKPLEPGTRYLWSVRARFKIDGRIRIIEWGLAGNLLRGQTVPNESCFRFKTPNTH